MKLHASAFITAVMGFLMILGANDQPVQVVQSQKPIKFSSVSVEDKFIAFKEVRVQVFDDLNCKSCSEFVNTKVKKLREWAAKEPQIQVELFFVPNINETELTNAAAALKCTIENEKVWALHARLHENKTELSEEKLINFTAELEIDSEDMTNCLKDPNILTAIENDVRYASELGVSVMPTMLINEYRLVGDQPFENIEKVINQLLNDRKSVFDLDDIEKLNQPTDLQKELEQFREAIE